MAFGADILWYFRRIVLLTILVPTIYLASADSLAIDAGTWTINPGKSLMIFISGLPIEEFIFFLTTNTLVVLGIILAGTIEGKIRLEEIIKSLRTKRNTFTEIASGKSGVAND
jgi:lycopene cyclase domain-containing protein